jgi:NAD(P)-dependent dehydrogenase (short-subunit alcohol dehydrogenase family)
MNRNELYKSYDFTGRTAVVTGGGGVLCSEMVITLAQLGANVAVLDRIPELPERVQQAVETAPGKVILVQSDVLDKKVLEASAREIIAKFGTVDTLINGAGGNKPTASTSAEMSFFDLPKEALGFVFDLNLLGTILPSQVFGREMAAQKSGVILNVSSMNAFRPLTRIPAYSAAKAGVSNFTQWLAVHMAQEYSPLIRVNAIAPGFLLSDQNRFLLTEKETGELTPRGRTILSHTPMNRFGEPEDLLGTVLWLLSPASAFVTGIVVPIDGGFSAFSGV